MKETGMLFKAPMVRALLDGSKTQTRRILNITHKTPGLVACLTPPFGNPRPGTAAELCPHGQPGDRIWVRETWRSTGDGGRSDYMAPRDMQPHQVWYDADGAAPEGECTGKTRTSIHMPRWASRILLEIVSVRVERLNDCSEADAKAEGVMQLDGDDSQRPEVCTKDGWQLCPTCAGTGLRSTLGAGGGVNFDVDCSDCDTHLKLYRHLWEAINGAGAWEMNPWCWAITFKRVAP
ncbi:MULTISPECIES: hypothetical protein [unclassified Janthinobacterium]|uniref:hypothetical protein n=1 Tax=unclassified Janthinobacterium TaxID=2610881 RepID=UPI001615D513|nr:MULTISPECIES: hypothetical protein [unclassified Janthinobacterium]MBB5610371.1 hypothetical protein [Janthinobacterium sp. S3T4]MBB5615792.1 hypothetical protein [Janthinobacterium sp. S3M3]